MGFLGSPFVSLAIDPTFLGNLERIGGIAARCLGLNFTCGAAGFRVGGTAKVAFDASTNKRFRNASSKGIPCPGSCGELNAFPATVYRTDRLNSLIIMRCYSCILEQNTSHCMGNDGQAQGRLNKSSNTTSKRQDLLAGHAHKELGCHDG
ncbi:hypothetical protein J3458_005655 [Metarhizium acridum]|uniref:uncharacterized protein n=1 Tax=Metarhizium acridum TaxID=92637 RepID=UPI001C6BE52D|nr:hypothetical protein J3458_005655 [Metarhizium acridum]